MPNRARVESSEASGGDICLQYESHRWAQHFRPMSRMKCCAFTLGGHRDPSLFRFSILADND